MAQKVERDEIPFVLSPHRLSRIAHRFASAKTDRMVACRTWLERDFVILLEADPQVRSYAERPGVLTFIHEHRTERTTRKVRHEVGFRIEMDGKDVLAAVLDDAQVAGAEETGLLRSLTAAIETCGKTAYVTKASDVRAQPRLANAKALVRERRRAPKPALIEAVRRELEGGVVAKLDDLVKAVGCFREDLLGMALRGDVTLDLGKPIGPETTIWLNAEVTR